MYFWNFVNFEKHENRGIPVAQKICAMAQKIFGQFFLHK
jgi:hypothetical protein